MIGTGASEGALGIGRAFFCCAFPVISRLTIVVDLADVLCQAGFDNRDPRFPDGEWGCFYLNDLPSDSR